MTASARTNGANLANEIRAGARHRGMAITDFVRRISSEPNKWLWQLERAGRPKPHTIARVAALLADQPIPAAPPNSFQAGPRKAPLFARELSPDVTRIPPAIDRDPCLRCGVRADIHAEMGCKSGHTR